MEKHMENEMETLGPFKGVYRDNTPMMENQREKRTWNINWKVGSESQDHQQFSTSALPPTQFPKHKSQEPCSSTAAKLSTQQCSSRGCGNYLVVSRQEMEE